MLARPRGEALCGACGRAESGGLGGMAADEGRMEAISPFRIACSLRRVPSTKISKFYYIHHASYSAGSCFASTTNAGAKAGS